QDGTCIEKQREKHIHIYISNTCKLSVSLETARLRESLPIFFDFRPHALPAPTRRGGTSETVGRKTEM
ncbi:MAG: hypothetical protein ABEN55_20710, partial [Bradymonadaceae bacterium]